MKVAVIYESFYGNTKEVAETIAEALSGSADVLLGHIDEIGPEAVVGVDLIVAGAPTHAHGMATQGTRRSAADGKKRRRQFRPGHDVMRDWMIALMPSRAVVATFDTRFHKPRWLTGSAAKVLARRFTYKGFHVVGSESFFVRTTDGPLLDGEHERAAAWARSLIGGSTASTAA